MRTQSVGDDNSRDFLGYVPLPLSYQDEASAEEGLCVSGEKSTYHVDCNNIHIYGGNHRQQIKQRVSALPRPRTVLLASLWAWTLLMTFSAKMGFNSLEQVSLPPTVAPSASSSMTRPSLVPTNVIQGGSSVSDTPIFILPPSMPFSESLKPQEDEDAGVDSSSWERISDLWSVEEQQQQQQQQGESGIDSIVTLLGMDIDVQFDAIDAVWAQDQPTAAENQDKEAQPFARIQTSIAIINGDNTNNDADSLTESSFLQVAEIEADIEDMSSLDAMIMDPQDEAIFQDFLHQLDQEEQAFELAKDQQRRKLFKTTNDLMVSSMLENDLPCGYYSRRSDGARLFSDIKWIVDLQQFLIGDSMSAADAGHYPGRTFVYTGWSTDLMIVAIAMCLGGVLVGLAQTKILCYQLMDQRAADSFIPTAANISVRRRASWTTRLAIFSLCTTALALTFLMIADESWDVPAFYFVGIGIAGIILVHTWVPNAALTIHGQCDITDDSSSNDEDGEDTCIESNEDGDSKLFSANSSLSTDDYPFVWSRPMAERRNACSLDVNRRWEVVATTMTSHETTGYIR
jgi:hypothetical protein